MDAAQAPQRHARRQAVAQTIGDCRRDEHLPAVRRAHDPRGAIDRAAEVIVVARMRRRRCARRTGRRSPCLP